MSRYVIWTEGIDSCGSVINLETLALCEVLRRTRRRVRYLLSNLTDRILGLFFYLSLFFLCCGLVYYGITNYSFLGYRTMPSTPILVPNYPARIILILSGIGAAAVFLKTIDTVASLREDD